MTNNIRQSIQGSSVYIYTYTWIRFSNLYIDNNITMMQSFYIKNVNE